MTDSSLLGPPTEPSSAAPPDERPHVDGPARRPGGPTTTSAPGGPAAGPAATAAPGGPTTGPAATEAPGGPAAGPAATAAPGGPTTGPATVEAPGGPTTGPATVEAPGETGAGPATTGAPGEAAAGAEDGGPPGEPPAGPPGSGRPGGPPPRPPDAPSSDVGTAIRLVALAAAGGIAFDLGLRGGLANVVVAVGVVLVVAVLLVDRRVVNPQARWVAAAAVVPALLLAVRASPWLVASNWVAVLGLLGLAVALSWSGSLLDTSPSRLVVRSVWALAGSFRAPLLLRPLVPRPSGETWTRLGRVVRALVIALPLLTVMVALLAAADPVFARLVLPDVDLDLGSLPGHVVLAGFFTAALLATASAADGHGDDRRWHAGFGGLEIATMLGLAAMVLGLFVVSQLVALTDAGDRLVAEAGLTPAEYARSGFFQLCWATAVLLGFLGLVRALAARDVLDRPVIRGLGAAVPLLALGLVGVSLRRMDLYDEAFGLTMLRLWVVGAAAWMGLVLMMLALRNAGVGGQRDWVVAGSGAAALVLVLLANLANPEAFVVRHNVARARHDGVELDGSYLGGLSADAVPDIVAALDDAPSGRIRDELTDALECVDDREVGGTASLNLGEARAQDALDGVATDSPTADDRSGEWRCTYRY